MFKRFQRKKEDFVCGACGKEVRGNGYTNHCPVCLWSKHVDVNPGDRKSECGGMMRPVQIEKKGRGWAVRHRCLDCGFEKNNKLSDGDDTEGFFVKGL